MKILVQGEKAACFLGQAEMERRRLNGSGVTGILAECIAVLGEETGEDWLTIPVRWRLYCRGEQYRLTLEKKRPKARYRNDRIASPGSAAPKI